MNRVGIFRMQMFKPSETFISGQARHLSRYDPIFVGRTLWGEPSFSAKIAYPQSASIINTSNLIMRRDPSLFVQALNGSRLSLLHAHFGVDGVYALALSRRLKIPLITTLHGFDVTTRDTSFLRSARPALWTYLLKRRELQRSGHLFCCVSKFIREAALRQGYPKDRTVVHYVGT
jgi:glycosyltransferase involved in cell wall biosynthesis